MPGVTLHVHLAETILRRAGQVSRLGIADWTRPDQANAFRMGALGPDLGYMPGGFRPLSDLAHCLRTADLARTLIARSRSATQRAFAAGWMSHFLADALIHPLVGLAVGEVIDGRHARFVEGDRAPAPHVQVEAGLDASYASRYPEVSRTRLEPVFGHPGIAFLAGAFEETYGVAPPSSALMRSHRLSARRGEQGLKIASLVSRHLSGRQGTARGHDPSVRTWASLRRTLGGRCVALAFLLPEPPASWLLEEVAAVEATFSDLFLVEWSSGGAGLQNVNLDTGRPDLDDRHHGGLRRTLEFLERAGGHIPASLKGKA